MRERYKSHNAMAIPPLERILSTQSIISVDVRGTPTKEDINGVSQFRKKKILTFGSCNLEVLGNDLSQYIDSTHIWRSSIVTLSSETVELRSNGHELKHVSDFVDREVNKIPFFRLYDSDHDIIIFDVAGDFLSSFIRIGNSIIINPCNENLGPDFVGISLSSWPEIEAGCVILPDGFEFWQLWRASFDRLYRTILLNKIRSGSRICVFRRYICELQLVNGEFWPVDRLNVVKERNRILHEIYEFVSTYDGIDMFSASQKLAFTSISAPRGKWEFHPDRPIYTMYGANLLRMAYPSSNVSNEYIVSALHNSAIEADAALARVAHLTGERDDALSRLQGAEAEFTAILARNNNEIETLRADRLGIEAEKTRLEELVRALVGEIEELKGERLNARTELIALKRRAEEEVARSEALSALHAGLVAEQEVAATRIEALNADHEALSARCRAAEGRAEALALQLADNADHSKSVEAWHLAEIQRTAEERTLSEEILRNELRSLRARYGALVDEVERLGPLNIFRFTLFGSKTTLLKSEILKLHRAGFSAEKYLYENPDVVAARVDPTEHYIRFGRREGRRAFFCEKK